MQIGRCQSCAIAVRIYIHSNPARNLKCAKIVRAGTAKGKLKTCQDDLRVVSLEFGYAHCYSLAIKRAYTT